MPAYGTPSRYRGPFFSDDDEDDQGLAQHPDADSDDPPTMPGMQFMPATPEDTSMYDPNVGDQDAFDAWLESEVYSKGYVIDMGKGIIIDPETGDVKGRVPTFYPRT